MLRWVAKDEPRKAEHPVIDLEVGDVGANAHDLAGALQSQRGATEAVLQHVFGQKTEAPHEIAEIQPGCFDLDFNFASRRPFALHRHPGDALTADADAPLQHGRGCPAPTWLSTT